MFSKIMDFWMTILGIKQPEAPKEQVEVTIDTATETVDISSLLESEPQLDLDELLQVEPVEEPQPVVDLDSMTKKQLVAFADEHNIEVDGRRKKEIIKQTIVDALG